MPPARMAMETAYPIRASHPPFACHPPAWIPACRCCRRPANDSVKSNHALDALQQASRGASQAASGMEGPAFGQDQRATSACACFGSAPTQAGSGYANGQRLPPSPAHVGRHWLRPLPLRPGTLRVHPASAKAEGEINPTKLTLSGLHPIELSREYLAVPCAADG